MLSIKTNTKQIDLSIEKNLHNNNDIMKPYMFQDGKVVPVILDGTIYDVLEYWNEDARVREGFQTEYDTKTVYVPNFFIKINGEFDSWSERRRLKKILKKESLCINSLEFAKVNLDSKYSEIKKLKKILSENYIISVSTLKNIMSVKELDDSIVNTLSSYQANYILDRLNFFMTAYMHRYKNDTALILKFIYNVVFLDKKIVEELQGWDYPYEVPKIVFFDKSNRPGDGALDYLFMHFLNFIGMDIAIVSPSGRASIEAFDFPLKDSVICVTLDNI